MNLNKIKNLLFLHAIIFLYALSAVCSKFAAGMEFFSIKWMLLYGLQIFILSIYAILWQQVLKRMPLNFAFANKSLTLIWGMLFGLIIFDEKITLFNIIGATIVLAGVMLMVTGNHDGDASVKCDASDSSSSPENTSEKEESHE